METGLVVLIVVVWTVIGVVLGASFERNRKDKTGTKGTIYVYCADQETGPSLLLECSVPIEDIASQKRVALDVVVIE